MEQVSREFLRALRGPRSQVQLSRRLGYRGNPITEWERGRRFPSVHELLATAGVSGVDVAAAFAAFTPSAPLVARAGEWQVAEWLDAVRGSTSIQDLARRAERSRHAVSRWLKGKATPRLPDFLRLVDAITGRVPDLVSEFVEIEQVPALLARHRAARIARGLAFEAPWTEAILRLLETASYKQTPRHHDQWLAAHLGVEPEVVRAGLERLVAAGLVRRRSGHFVSQAQSIVDTRAAQTRQSSLKRHWCQVATDRVTTPREADLFAYNVISVAHSDLLRVKELLRATFREIRGIVAASEPEEVAALVNLQLITFVPIDADRPQ